MSGRETRTHGEMMRTELGVGFDHLRQAATHAAGGVGATVGPRLNSAMERVGPGTERVRDVASQGWGTTVAALTPLMDAARTGAAEAGRQTARQTVRARKKMTRKKRSTMSGKRTGMLVGLLAVGLAAGAAGAMAARRRSRSRWEEYEAGGRSVAGDQAQSVLDSTRSAMDMAAGKASGGDADLPAGAPDEAAGWSGKGSPSRQERSGRAGSSPADKATAVTKNSHS